MLITQTLRPTPIKNALPVAVSSKVAATKNARTITPTQALMNHAG